MTDHDPTTRRFRPWLRRHLGAALLAGTALAGLSAAPFLAAAEQPGQAAPGTSAAIGPANGPLPMPGQSKSQAQDLAQNHPPLNQGQAMPERLPSFVSLVKQVKPAVVSVTNYLKDTAEAGDQDTQHAPQLPFPFNQMPFGQTPFGQRPQPRAVEARGSGFIVNPDGLIITNNHVVKDERRVEVTLSTGEKMTAKVIGTDPRTDIAVLKVNPPHPLPYLQLGDSATCSRVSG